MEFYNQLSSHSVSIITNSGTTLCSQCPEQKSELSAAWRSGSEGRFYDDHDRKVDGSPPNLVSLLRPWIRCFTMIISAWWNLASSKLKKSEENSSGKLGNKGNSKASLDSSYA